MEFREYKENGNKWITTMGNDIFPDYLNDAMNTFTPYIKDFFKLSKKSPSSIDLFKKINKLSGKQRIQYLRIFRRYIAPELPVEMLKKKKFEPKIIEGYGDTFRNNIEANRIHDQNPDEYDKILSALLYEYKYRGQKGYDLTGYFFDWFNKRFPEFTIIGPKGAGTDLQLYDYLPNYIKHNTPTDFIIFDESKKVLAVGYARYDSDRGGSQEDDRIGGNRDKVTLIRQYNKKQNSNIKVVFLNDGPGLLLGSMWNDYSEIEDYGKGIAMVTTLKMLDTRLTKEWLLS